MKSKFSRDHVTPAPFPRVQVVVQHAGFSVGTENNVFIVVDDRFGFLDRRSFLTIFVAILAIVAVVTSRIVL
jgi:hypothetical protein